MNSELSQNVSASLEGWYSDNWSWRWIEWQYCCLAAAHVRLHLVRRAAREDRTRRCCATSIGPGSSMPASVSACSYAGLDQGNRLDWNNNGLVNGLLIAGALVTLAFVVRELVIAKPFLNLRLLARRKLVLILLMLAGFRFIILSTAYIIPTYLQSVQNYRELQVGSVLLWIALPQFAIVLPLGALLKRVDGRWVLALGATLIGIAWLMGTDLTSDWATDDFLPRNLYRRLASPLH